MNTNYSPLNRREFLKTLAMSPAIFYANKSNSELSPKKKSEIAPSNDSDTYAVLYNGMNHAEKIEELRDPIDKNSFWVNLVKVYNGLMQSKINPQNIFVLSYDGKPDFTDNQFGEDISAIQKKFKDPIRNCASKDNLISTLNTLENKISINDKLIIFMGSHSSGGMIFSAFDDMYIHPKELSESLKKINNYYKLGIFDICFAGKFINSLSAHGTYLGASSSEHIAWNDRELSFSGEFFNAVNNMKNNNNESVSIEEAYKIASQSYKNKGLNKKTFILGEYLNKIKDPKEKEYLKKEYESMDFETIIKKVI